MDLENKFDRYLGPISFKILYISTAMILMGEILNESNSLLDKYSLLMHCIKIKSPAKFLLNEQYVFVGGNISFLCVLSCSSEEA